MAEKTEKAKSGLPDKYFPDQFEDEEVLYVFRKHPIVMRKGLIFSSVAVLAGPLYTLGLTFANPNNPPSIPFFFTSMGLSFVLAGLIFMPWWITWHFSVFVITNQRLIQVTQKGFFHHSVVDMGLRQIQMVNYEVAGLEQTLLGFGTIMMQTMVGDLVIHDIHHPAKIQKKILEILREQGITATTYAQGDSGDDTYDEEDTQTEEEPEQA
ncbi:MAG TPA: PH domain-containing protein [Candidatus Saccharimonadales bacterium]|nr:PH domain-containing protein [Candidatus Saccharimonadales bacterium]